MIFAGVTLAVVAGKGGIVRRHVVTALILAILSVTFPLMAYGHGGDTNLVHSCVRNSTGAVRIIGPSGTCNANETPHDWPTAAAFLALQGELADLRAENVSQAAEISSLKDRIANLESRESPTLGIRDSSRGLVIKNNDAAPASIIDVTAAEVILQNGRGEPLRVAPVALSVDADSSGTNGIDIGIRQPDKWYHVWIIFNPASNSAAGLLSLDPDEPVLPLGYDHKARVGAIRTEAGTGNLIRIHQVSHRVMREPKRAILQTSQVFLKPVSIESLVPPTAKQVFGSWDTWQYATAGYGLVAATPQGLSSKAFGYVFSLDGREGNLNTFGSYELPIAVPQTLYLTLYNGAVLLSVSGWEF